MICLHLEKLDNTFIGDLQSEIFSNSLCVIVRVMKKRIFFSRELKIQ